MVVNLLGFGVGVAHQCVCAALGTLVAELVAKARVCPTLCADYRKHRGRAGGGDITVDKKHQEV